MKRREEGGKKQKEERESERQCRSDYVKNKTMGQTKFQQQKGRGMSLMIQLNKTENQRANYTLKLNVINTINTSVLTGAEKGMLLLPGNSVTS